MCAKIPTMNVMYEQQRTTRLGECHYFVDLNDASYIETVQEPALWKMVDIEKPSAVDVFLHCLRA